MNNQGVFQYGRQFYAAHISAVYYLRMAKLSTLKRVGIQCGQMPAQRPVVYCFAEGHCI